MGVCGMQPSPTYPAVDCEKSPGPLPIKVGSSAESARAADIEVFRKEMQRTPFRNEGVF